MGTSKIQQAQYDLFDTARFFSLLKNVNLNEREFRLVVAAVAEAESSWNISYIASCANVSRSMVYDGMEDLHGDQLRDRANGERRRGWRARGARTRLRRIRKSRT